MICVRTGCHVGFLLLLELAHGSREKWRPGRRRRRVRRRRLVHGDDDYARATIAASIVLRSGTAAATRVGAAGAASPIFASPISASPSPPINLGLRPRAVFSLLSRWQVQVAGLLSLGSAQLCLGLAGTGNIPALTGTTQRGTPGESEFQTSTVPVLCHLRHTESRMDCFLVI